MSDKVTELSDELSGAQLLGSDKETLETRTCYNILSDLPKDTLTKNNGKLEKGQNTQRNFDFARVLDLRRVDTDW